MFLFTSPGSVAFSILGFDIYFYGIFMAFAILFSLLLSNLIANKFYNFDNIIIDISPFVLLFGVLGARLYYCILNYSYYFNHPFEVFAFRNGGLSIHGALFSGFISLLIISKKYNLKFLDLLDIFAYTIPLGQSIARWGNFFNSEAFGYPTNLAWKLFIPIEARPLEYINNAYFHPTFLYESILDFCIFLVMMFLLNKKYKLKSGIACCIYLILYSLVRIFVECFRIDCVKTIFGIQVPILVSILIIGFSLFYILKKRF